MRDDPELSEKELNEIGLQIPSCGACLSNMAISPDGGIVPCQSWLSDKPLGNIRDESWGLSTKDFWYCIWNYERCKAIRENSAKLNYQCPLKTNC